MTRNVQQLLTEHIDLWTSATENKSSAGRGNSRKKSLYGIKKLRELILELAVRGKLVAQDPNDEPASELLMKIEAERGQLVKDGKIKKPKKLPEISEEEKSIELPEGWEWARFIDVLNFSGGGQPPKSTFSEDKKEGYVQLIQIRDLGPKPQPVYVPKDKVSKFCSPSDVMVGRYGASVGKVFWGKEGAYNVALIKIHNDFAIYTNQFIYLMLTSPHGQNLFNGISRSAQDGFSKDDIAPKLMPVVPKAEQHRIVAKVDELMALCDQLEQQTEQQLDAHQLLVDTLLGTLTQSQNANELADNWTRLSQHFDTLFTTEASIDQLKQTVLQLAVMGKLVPQNPNDEPARELLKRIAAEKEQLIKDKKIKKQKPLPPISDEEKPFELPEGWEWVRFDDIVDIQGGIAKGRKIANRETSIVPYLSVANVQRGHLDLSNVKEIELPIGERDRFQVLLRDLLITEGGDWDKVGRTAIWNNSIEYMAHQNHVFKARIILKTQNETWLEHFLNSAVAREYFAGSSKQTTNLASINKTQLRSCLIASPPLPEQHRIIIKTNELFLLCDLLKERLQHNQQTQLLLTDTLVQEALV